MSVSGLDRSQGAPSIDSLQKFGWPDVARRPAVHPGALLATAMMQRLVRQLPFDVVHYPDGGQTKDGGLPRWEIRDPKALYRRLAKDGLIGLGESYQAGEWDSDRLPELLAVFAANIDDLLPGPLSWLRTLHGRRHRATQNDPLAQSRSDIEHHYNLSNELFRLFLDETMTYSCAIFEPGVDDSFLTTDESLERAQIRKIERLLDLANVRDGVRLLEIGTGWGELAARAAERGASVHTITLSTAQAELARQRVAQRGLSERVQISVQDYRNVNDLMRSRSESTQFDSIISVEMMEHVGEKNWPTYFSTMSQCLKPGGRIVVQTSTMSHHWMRSARRKYTWLHKYVFPGFLVPSVVAIEKTLRSSTDLHLIERHAYGSHYVQTLTLWRSRFRANLDRVAELGFDDKFIRTWEFYLAYAEAGFRAGYMDVEQLVLGRRTAGC